MAYKHKANPHLAHRKQPPKKVHEHAGSNFNGRLAVKITAAVGTMACAYAFTVLALISLPTILKQAGFGVGFDLGDGTVLLVSWVAQTFLQLVLLSVIIVGQNIQARASDDRAERTYKDAEAVLHEAREIQRHLQSQDEVLTSLITAKKATGK